MRFIFILISSFWYLTLAAQEKPEDVVYQFFQAMADVDTAYLDKVMQDDMILSSTAMIGDQNKIILGSREKFIASIAKSQKGDLDEQISNLRVHQDDGLANVWMEYEFYYQGAFSHCGVNNFTLALNGSEWKIISLADTRRKSNCKINDSKKAINKMLDEWHMGATNADSTAYFDLMTTNSIYVGTDKTEVWSKREFLSFAAPYFAKGKAWAFVNVERNVYSEDFARIAWFDEVLDTWMGPCRGSGVVVKDENGSWKVQHYVLSVAVDNEDIQDYLKIIDKAKK